MEVRANSSSFDEHLAQPAPEWLYHYTTQVGLLGIVEEGQLRATKIQYMNDSTEFEWALNIAEKVCCDRNVPDLFPRRAGIANANIFAACFCENGDLLSQWRAYSGSAYGFALGMHASTLFRIFNQDGFQCGRCIYDAERQAQIVGELVTDSLKQRGELNQQAAFERGLIRVGTFFKHEKFNEENEWRIATGPMAITDAKVGFKPGQSMPTPYFRLDLGKARDSAIKHITVGPSPHLMLSKSSVAMLMHRHGLLPESIESQHTADVRESSIPFRNW